MLGCFHGNLYVVLNINNICIMHNTHYYAYFFPGLNGGGLSDSHGSPSKVSFPGSVTQKVVVQMPQNGTAQLQMQSQQQIQLSALMQHQQQQQQQQHQQQQHQLETTSQTLNHQQQQALLAALQHHDKLKGFSLDVSDGTSHQSTPTQSPTSAINVSVYLVHETCSMFTVWHCGFPLRLVSV